MSEHIHYFSKEQCFGDEVNDKIGIRGIRAKDLNKYISML